jgi:hypothetical protein
MFDSYRITIAEQKLPTEQLRPAHRALLEYFDYRLLDEHDGTMICSLSPLASVDLHLGANNADDFFSNHPDLGVFRDDPCMRRMVFVLERNMSMQQDYGVDSVAALGVVLHDIPDVPVLDMVMYDGDRGEKRVAGRWHVMSDHAEYRPVERTEPEQEGACPQWLDHASDLSFDDRVAVAVRALLARAGSLDAVCAEVFPEADPPLDVPYELSVASSADVARLRGVVMSWGRGNGLEHDFQHAPALM